MTRSFYKTTSRYTRLCLSHPRRVDHAHSVRVDDFGLLPPPRRTILPQHHSQPDHFPKLFRPFRRPARPGFLYLTFNSFKISILTVIGQVLTCAMAAFVFAIVKFKGRDFLFALLVATLMIPPQVSLIPNFIIFKYLGWIGTQLPLIVPAFWGGAFGTFLLRQYFLTIPRDLVDAARMDGASLFDIFWRIYMPLSKPAVAALAIFVFKDAWNDLLHPLVYLPTDMHKTTLTVGLAFFQQQLQMGGKFTVLMAGAFLSIVPLLIIFFIAQKQFIEGIALAE